jgi:hypothetical protein
MLKQGVLHDRHTGLRAKVEKSVLITNETLWNNKLEFVEDVL